MSLARLPGSALRFGAVGLTGFVVDALLLTWLTAHGLAVLPARCISFAVAVSATFVLNRHFTFRSARPRRTSQQFALYWGVQACGAGVNFVVFLSLVHGVPALTRQPWLALAVASGCAMLLTYTLSRWLFEGRQH